MKYIDKYYISDKYEHFKIYMDAALEDCPPGDMADHLTRDQLYTLRMYIIALGKELGMPLEDGWAKLNLDELSE